MTVPGGIDRLARRMLKDARGMSVPNMDPDQVAPVVDVLEFAAAAGFPDLDPWQVEALTSTNRKLIFLCSRQAGKSTVSGILVAHNAVTCPGSLGLVGAPSLRQSGELFRSVKHMVKAATSALDLPGVAHESALRLELENGARIVALPGSSEGTVRGYSAANLVVLDEAARVTDELIAAIRPTLATTNGRIIALSTPAGKRGWYFLEWSSGVGWERTRITAEDCPRISEEFLADELRALGPHVYGSEYLCEFYDPDTSVFSTELIELALSFDVRPLWEVAA